MSDTDRRIDAVPETGSDAPPAEEPASGKAFDDQADDELAEDQSALLPDAEAD